MWKENYIRIWKYYKGKVHHVEQWNILEDDTRNDRGSDVEICVLG